MTNDHNYSSLHTHDHRRLDARDVMFTLRADLCLMTQPGRTLVRHHDSAGDSSQLFSNVKTLANELICSSTTTMLPYFLSGSPLPTRSCLKPNDSYYLFPGHNTRSLALAIGACRLPIDFLARTVENDTVDFLCRLPRHQPTQYVSTHRFRLARHGVPDTAATGG